MHWILQCLHVSLLPLSTSAIAVCRCICHIVPSFHRVTFAPLQLFRPSDKNVCVVGLADGAIQHWDVDERMIMSTIREEDNEVHAVDFRQDGFMYATVGRDSAVRVYDESTNKLTNCWQGPGCHSDQLFAVKWSRESKNMLLTAGWDDRVKVGGMGNSYAVIHFHAWP